MSATKEPPSTPLRFTVAQDSRGRWTVSDVRGLIGGIFRDRDSAVRFARFESDHVPGAVACLEADRSAQLAPMIRSNAA